MPVASLHSFCSVVLEMPKWEATLSTQRLELPRFWWM